MDLAIYWLLYAIATLGVARLMALGLGRVASPRIYRTAPAGRR